MLVAAVLIALQFVVFSRTQIGRKLRATTQDREMAQAIGIPALRMIAITFGIGASLAGVAGALLANQYFVWPTGGVSLTVFAYMAVVIGGWGSIAGAVRRRDDHRAVPGAWSRRSCPTRRRRSCSTWRCC